MLILRGLQNILSYFINIKYQFTKKRENFDKNFWIKFINDFHNQTKQNSTSFGELISKLFSNDELDEKEETENKFNIPNVIYLQQLKSLLISFLICWNGESQSYMNKDYCLNNNGILKFKGNDNYIVNKNNIELNYEENDSKEQIRNILIDLTFNLFVKNTIFFMNNYINIWCESQ